MYTKALSDFSQDTVWSCPQEMTQALVIGDPCRKASQVAHIAT